MTEAAATVTFGFWSMRMTLPKFAIHDISTLSGCDLARIRFSGHLLAMLLV